MNNELLVAMVAHTGKELRNHHLYLAAYSWARAIGWEGFSKRWKNAAVEEAKHAQNFVKFCARYGAHFSPWPELDKDPIHESLEELAALEYALELDTENSMSNLVVLAEKVGDMAAVEWLSGKLLEQQKDTKQSDDFATRVSDAARSSDGAMVILDRQLERKGW
jgi:ferritin